MIFLFFFIGGITILKLVSAVQISTIPGRTVPAPYKIQNREKIEKKWIESIQEPKESS
jgi:hypothetical protein